MGEGFSVCVNGPRKDDQLACECVIERLSGDFGEGVPIDGKDSSVATVSVSTTDVLNLLDTFFAGEVVRCP